ncbi:hypothetical protein [Nocardia sp. NPDC005366]|uniref:hypothetical protein n=1 Tax=Nocardia sp. NPDC005366 TaxID=3156878 RepID=UPI0033B0D2F3
MCEEHTQRTERAFGEIYRLCQDDPIDHLLDLLKLRRDTDRPKDDQPARSLLQVFCSKANVVVVEKEYFDLDFRSEFSKVHEVRFGSRSSDTARIHFFRGSIPRRRGVHLRDFVAKQSTEYFGYSVLRPQFPGRIGRSMVSADLTVPELAGDRTLADKVRTAVGEDIQVFGVARQVVGVPFMEQDGHLFTCAHVTAWVCHYTAVLRGAVPRRATAQFHGISDKTAAFGRVYPSQGLNRTLLAATLRAVDLPPEIIDADSLSKQVNLNWANRRSFSIEEQKIRDQRRVTPEDTALFEQHRSLWIRENLGASVCRYLNSALPVILLRAPAARGDVAHAQVAVGYLRQSDLAASRSVTDSSTQHREAADDNGSEVVALIVCDDQKGPYQIVMLDELVQDFMDHNKSLQTSIVVPLPRSVWLPGSAAEEAAAQWLKAVAEDRMNALNSQPDLLRSKDADVYRERLQDFVEQVSGMRVGELAIRSYITTGTEFKESIARRLGNDRMLARAVGYTQLPKYVWVSEAIDRKLRNDRGRSVLATIVFDSTIVTVEGRLGTAGQLPLVVHIPGQAVCSSQYNEYYSADLVQKWFPAHADPYYTGRWNRHSNNREYTRRHWKSAMSVSNE